LNLRSNIFLLLGIIALTSNLFGQTTAAPGTDEILDLSNGMQTGGDWGNGEHPSGRRTNPSILAEVDVPVIDVGYVGLGESSEAGEFLWNGHALGATLLYPLQRGSLGFSLQFSSLTAQSLNLGTRLHLGTSWARELPSGIQIGAGIHGGFGGANQTLDWSLGADLGISQRILLNTWAQEIFWGASLTSLGKELRPIAGSEPSISPFTLRGGVVLGLGNRDLVYFTPGLFLEFPSFQNLRVDLQTGMQFFDLLKVDLSWGIDVKQLQGSMDLRRPLYPTIGISLRLPTEDDRPREYKVDDYRTFGLSLAPWTSSQWGIGVNTILPLGTRDRTGPEIGNLPELPLHLSPNNDGVKDRIIITSEISDPSGVGKISFEIFDSNSRLVYSEIRTSASNDLHETTLSLDYFFGSFVDLQLSQPFTFSGRSNESSNLPDGEYSLIITGWDHLGNTNRALASPIIIDTTEPDLGIEQPGPEERIFSPNGDGNKDTYTFRLQGSIEPSWVGSIQNSSGLIVRHLDFSGASPEPFEWDGLDNRGQRVPDGVYELQITGTDFAGNSRTGEFTNLIVNTYIDPVRLQISRRAFSPNNDGVADQLLFNPEITRQQGVIDWKIEVLNSKTEIVRTLFGEGVPPESVVFDGNFANENQIPDGEYNAELSVTYQNGNVPRATSPQFSIDRVAPFALTALEWSIMSPGMGSTSSRDTMLFYQDTSDEELWEAQIRNSQNYTVFRTSWSNGAPNRFEWNGVNDETSSVPDGIFSYLLTSEDRAGNSFTTDPLFFSIDTSSAEYRIALNTRAFSPNSDGVRDLLEIGLTQQQKSVISAYTLSIVSETGQTKRSFTGGAVLPPRIVWDGKDSTGFPVPDGQYQISLKVRHNNGSEFDGEIGPILLDTEFPRLEVGLSSTVFSPNNDGNLETINLLGSSKTTETLIASIVDEKGQIIRSQSFNGTSASITWDGTDSIGNLAADGFYRYRLETTDSAGNYSQTETETFTLDTRVATAFVTLGSRGFSPNNDGRFETIEIGMFLNLLEGLESWELTIQNSQGYRVKNFSGEDAQESMTVKWDGIDNDGRITSGTYRAVFSARYQKGDSPESISQDFVLDREGPEVSLIAAPQPFSPDDDGVDDEIEFRIQAQDISGIAAWNLEIFDRTGSVFQQFGGRGIPPSSLFWDGIRDNGETVLAAEDYPYRLSLVDTFGNRSQVQGVVVTDIFVTRDGDKLYIQIANITFEPNSPILVTSADSAVGIRNSLILDRLVQLFDRYPSYRIRIEGHAVNVTGTEREQTQELVPLAEGRANSVKQALVNRGMNQNRISILGVGGANPLVPHTDRENRWKNRRVEFVLER